MMLLTIEAVKVRISAPMISKVRTCPTAAPAEGIRELLFSFILVAPFVLRYQTAIFTFSVAPKRAGLTISLIQRLTKLET